MRNTLQQMGLIMLVFGLVSLILGSVAENKRLAAGTPVPSGDGVVCMYPANPSVPLGYLSVAFLIASTVTGYLSLLLPYKGKFVPLRVLFKDTEFIVFFSVALGTAGLAAAMLLWPTISDQVHLAHNVHCDVTYKCITAKAGLFGGGALFSLASSALWLVVLMLANNAREDFFYEEYGDRNPILLWSKPTSGSPWVCG